MQKNRYEKYLAASEYIKEKIKNVPKIAVVIGSAMTDFVDDLKVITVIKYKDIPFFPVSTVSYQKGELIYGEINDSLVIVMNGRFHYYEGYDMSQTVFHIYVFKLLGIDKIIITNAAGGIDYSYNVGDFVVITDHIKLCADSPLRGENLSEFGQRFFDTQSVYDKKMMDLTFKTAENLDISVKKGVYAFMGGPQYETPAEIRMLRMLGATLVGMSTVPEIIACAHCKISVLAISCVCNLASGMTENEVTSEEVEAMGKKSSSAFTKLIYAIIHDIEQKN